jgi:pimeloyl-ACP methyl ester carboxylesterase
MAAVTPPEEQPTLLFTRSWLPAPHRQELAYRVAGSGQPVVLFHGLWNSSSIWQETIQTFSPYYRLYAPDLPGHGQSPPRLPWKLREVGAMLAAWMRSLELSPATVIGHSMGGALAMLLAAAEPELVDRLVLVDAAGLPMKQPLLRALTRAGLGLTNRQTLRYRSRYGFGNRLQSLATLQAADEVLACDLRPELSAIRCPTLIIWGTRDPLLPAHTAALLQRSIQGAELVLLPNVRHQPQRQVPHIFHNILDDFLERWNASNHQVITEASD